MWMILFAGILGWICGAGVNYLSDLLPNTRRLGTPVCIHCFEKQSVGNYLFWPRRCNSCEKIRPFRVWAVEVIYVAASIRMWIAPPERFGYSIGLVLLTYLGVVFVIDLEHRVILHPVSWVGAFLGFGIGVWRHGLVETLIGGAVGFGIMLALYYFGAYFANWLARRRGEENSEIALGFGDVNLAGVLGLLMGWPGITAGLVLAIFLGGGVSLIYVIAKVFTKQFTYFMAIPYGPFLVGSAVILLYLTPS